jgi:hypothetical protein
LWLLHNANPQLAAGKEVEVVGTIYVVGPLSRKERQQCEKQLLQALDVSCPGLPSCERVMMRLQLEVV